MGLQFIEKLPRIFCTEDALNELIQNVQSQLKNPSERHYEDLPFAIEIIGLPYTVVWTPATEDVKEVLSITGYPKDRGSDALMFMLPRYESGTDTDDIQAMIVAADHDGTRGLATMCRNNLLSSSINGFYTAVVGVNRFFQDEDIYSKYINLDPVKEGLLFDAKDGKIVATVVSGKERPDMECFIKNSLHSSYFKKRRPYSDEENTYDDTKEAKVEIAKAEFQIENGILIRYNGKDTDVVVPDGIRTVGDGNSMTFFQTNVVSVQLPETVTAIGGYAFYNCNTLKKITIPDRVTSIGHHAFRQCSSLKSIRIPDGVSVIERECFWGCTGMEEITLPKSLKTIEEKAFSGCISVKSITIPEGTVSIDDGAFWGDAKLKSITIPASVTEIGEMAFCDCNNLTIFAPVGSFAEKYARDNNIPVMAPKEQNDSELYRNANPGTAAVKNHSSIENKTAQKEQEILTNSTPGVTVPTKEEAKSKMESITSEIIDKTESFKNKLSEIIKQEKEPLAAKAKSLVAQKEGEILSLIQQKKSLGLFSFSEKKEIDQKIADINNEINNLKDGKWMNAQTSISSAKASGYLEQYRKETQAYLSDRFPYKKRLEELSKSNPEKILGIQAYNVLVRNGKRMRPLEIDGEIPGKRKPDAVYGSLEPYILSGQVEKSKNDVGWTVFRAKGYKELTFEELLGINEFYEDPSMKDTEIPEPPQVSKLSDEL